MKKTSSWTVKYWFNHNENHSVEAWFDSLTQEQFKSVAREMKLLELSGNQLRLPHSRPLKKGLFELRERKFGFRIYYTLLPNQTVFILNAGSKKEQDKDIQIARKRLNALSIEKEGEFMGGKKFQDYLEKRLSKSDIADIEKKAMLEVNLLKSLQKDIAKAISTYMEDKKIGFNEFARLSNMSPTQLAKIQKGEANLTLATIAHVFALIDKKPHLVFDKNS